MTKYQRGSEWRRWDLHIHTPKSILYNGFGTDFDDYVRQLFRSALSNKIAAIGITDYFSIEGYKKLKKDYLDKDEKLRDIFPDEKERDAIKHILILPNIEFRLNNFVGRDDRSINYHVIFSDKVSIQDIEENFLNKIEFISESTTYGIDNKLTLSEYNLQQFGKKLKGQQPTFTGSDYKVGIEHATVDHSQITTILNQNSAFVDKYITCVPADKDLSSMSWDGRDHTTRKVLIQKSNCLFTPNESNIKWGLGLKSESVTEFVNEFKALKPSIHGSDAHEYSKLFKPDNDKYCWIKADPTFDGLLQILYEPQYRVKIQTTKPDSKPNYNTIDHIIINNPDFSYSDEPVKIYLNPNLSCIIGGKSTGKSLLLNNTAYAIDKEQVNTKYLKTQPERKKSKTDKFTPISGFNVVWTDGTVSKPENTNKKKIIYIPQTYLNRLSDEREETTEIDMLVREILLQNSEVNAKHEETELKLSQYKKETDKLIYDYIDVLNQIKSLEANLLDNNDSKAIKAEIEKLEAEKQSNIKGLNISSEQTENYELYCDEKVKIQKEKKYLEYDKYILNLIKSINLDMPIELKSFQSYIKDDIKIYLEELQSLINDSWIVEQAEFENKINNKISEIDTRIKFLDAQILVLEPYIKSNHKLKQITDKIRKEKDKLGTAKSFESKLHSYKLQASKTLDNLVKKVSKYNELLQFYTEYVNEKTNLDVEGLTFKLEVVFRLDSFKSQLLEVLNNKTLSRFEYCSLSSFDVSNYSEDFIRKLILSVEKNDSTSLQLKGQYSFENVLRLILDNWYNINYVVTMDNDEIHKMSPGKKALVLLKLLIGLAESDCPMLIDQPEDDLDNRSIYYDLINYIKDKKLERQIIIVTHNANIVVGADSEQVIVANQQGQNTPNKNFKFEYKSGSIEDNWTNSTATCILEGQGIQEHICEILEGGKPAFDKRKQKYNCIHY